MNVTNYKLFDGCLIASISHSIMTNVYPDLSYEQSWDGVNYSIQNTEGLRGTITFCGNYCIGAIRNENAEFIGDSNFIQKLTSNFPRKVIDKANKETLQYLLVEINGKDVPFITSIFWADNNTFHFQRENMSNTLDDLILFEKILLPKNKAIKEWGKYYDMDSNAINLLRYLYSKKVKHFSDEIVLTDKQKRLIPGSSINNECIESFNELNIRL